MPSSGSEATSQYVKTYGLAMAGLPNLRIDAAAAANSADAVLQLAQGGRIENYTRETFVTPEIRESLVRIDAAMGPTQQNGTLNRPDSDRLKAVVNDLLMASALIPVHERTIRDTSTLGATTLERRRAIEVMSRDDLVDVLSEIDNDIQAGRSPFNEDGVLQHVGYQTGAPLAQRYARLGALNLQPNAQKQLMNNPTFVKLLESDLLPHALYAASGHEEQRFLNTCVVAAANSEILSRTPTIMGLVVVGRGIADACETHLYRMRNVSDGRYLNEAEDRRFFIGPKITVGQQAEKRLRDARAVFGKIERDLDAFLGGKKAPGRDPEAALVELTKKWSRTVQKVSGVAFLGGAAGVPVLSNKIIPGAWVASAIVAAPLIFDRPTRRLGGASRGQAKYLMAIQANIKYAPITQHFEHEISGRTSSDPEFLSKFWQRVQRQNGIQVANSGHQMFVKAVEKDGEQIFAISNPKVAQFKYLTKDQFQKWAGREHAATAVNCSELDLLPKTVEQIRPAGPVGDAHEAKVQRSPALAAPIEPVAEVRPAHHPVKEGLPVIDLEGRATASTTPSASSVLNQTQRLDHWTDGSSPRTARDSQPSEANSQIRTAAHRLNAVATEQDAPATPGRTTRKDDPTGVHNQDDRRGRSL